MNLGLPKRGTKGRARRRRDTHIPWSYGIDRIVAAAIDPNRLFVWWEVTDEAIDVSLRALASLEPAAGADASLALRVYDITGRLFDGTNAHHYFDHRVDRHDRQWFFSINRPSAAIVVEVGLLSASGRFVRIARSKRVDFPRNAPAPDGEAQWMTVRATGEIEQARVERSATPDPPPAPSCHNPDDRLGLGSFTPIQLWVVRDMLGEGRTESWQTSWRWNGATSWLEAATTTWTAGPFEYPVEIEAPSTETWQGGAIAFRAGDVTHVVHSPWHVIIRNLGARRERAVVSRWQMVRSWIASARRERTTFRASEPMAGEPITMGASDGIFLGASERAWLSGSELRLGGASERWRGGASELRLGGASELLYAGASQWMLGGASELRFEGASERRFFGGSERSMSRWG